MKKKLLSIGFALILMIGLLPSQAFAVDADDPQLEAFLESIDWELEDYEDYLAEFDFELADFEDPAYLGTPLTDEGLEDIYETYDLTYDELNDLLHEEEGFLEEGEEFPDSFWYMFIEDIELSLELITNDSLATDDEISDESLEELAQAYDFGSIEELEELFNNYGDSINNYTMLFEVESAVEVYTTLGDSSELDDDLSEEDEGDLWGSEEDLWEEDNPWDSSTDLTAELFNTSILSDEPIVDIYAMISVMLLESLLDLQ
ncbi:processed acidic surface protein [Oceanobacillus sp. CFH 90083]|uniref:processed acidic surface protein n=1 Tax=Oceanobacillus sp. CFH 90083 TaxID=2592336 RepID=UPI00128BDABD|nr:processed acidic surface protein [Oceanobacillus sp. CFH 90083]